LLSYADMVGVSMTAVRIVRAVTVFLLLLLWVGCGEYYRPVATPIIPTQPNPSFNHSVLVISTNGASNPGASTTIDVSGDTAISQATVGLMPVHAALVQNASRVYVANSMDDSVSLFSPSSPTPVITISLPTGSAPDFVASTESATVYVANHGNGTVSAISTINNVVTNTITVGPSPVNLAELANGQKLYVVTSGNGASSGSVLSINTIDKSLNPPIVASTTAPWISPVWVVTRADSQRVYVLDKTSGFVSAIDPASDTVVATVSVGTGAEFMVYDPELNRVYVANRSSSTVFALDASTDQLTAMKASVSNPVSLAALLDGTRIYVSSTTFPASGSVTSQVTVLNAVDLSTKKTIVLTSVPTRCAATPFELYMAAAADSSRVYVGNCDAGNTAIIQTSNDTLLQEVKAPLGAFGPPATSPPLQSPVFVLAGP
jgi:large repetitive protein